MIGTETETAVVIPLSTTALVIVTTILTTFWTTRRGNRLKRNQAGTAFREEIRHNAALLRDARLLIETQMAQPPGHVTILPIKTMSLGAVEQVISDLPRSLTQRIVVTKTSGKPFRVRTLKPQNAAAAIYLSGYRLAVEGFNAAASLWNSALVSGIDPAVFLKPLATEFLSVRSTLTQISQFMLSEDDGEYVTAFVKHQVSDIIQFVSPEVRKLLKDYGTGSKQSVSDER